MDQIITFDKSYQQRLQEYEEIFGSCINLPSYEVSIIWSSHLEITVDPCGWQAIWKIPCETCESLKIFYPVAVLVYVDGIDFDNLTAEIKILTVQDDIQLPESHVVNLHHLWPTKQQDDTICLNLLKTADDLDALRFFYNHLWRPWDIEDDNIVHWYENHLESRLRLYYDMKLGIISKAAASQFRSVLHEAKCKQIKLERLRELNDVEDADADALRAAELDEKICLLIELNMDVARLITKVKLIENSETRAKLLENQKFAEEDICEMKEGPTYWLVFQADAPSATKYYIEYLQKVNLHISGETECLTASSLQDALENASPDDVVLLGTGKHSVLSSEALKKGGVIKGVCSERAKTVIESVNEDLMLDFCGHEVLLENLTLNIGSIRRGIVIHSGTVRLRNCTLLGNSESSVQQGILTLAGSTLTMENCQISGFATAIIADSYSAITLTDCVLSNTTTALKIFDSNIVNISNCIFSNCEKCAIFVETENCIEKQIGDSSLLNSLSNMNISDCKFQANPCGDVILSCKPKIIPVRDLFSNSAFNTTLMKH